MSVPVAPSGLLNVPTIQVQSGEKQETYECISSTEDIDNTHGSLDKFPDTQLEKNICKECVEKECLDFCNSLLRNNVIRNERTRSKRYMLMSVNRIGNGMQ